MKTIQSILVAFAMMFAMMVPVQADTDFQSFSQDDGMSALRAGDAMGLEVIPRKELEEVRGEGLLSNVKAVWNKSYAIRVLWTAYQAYDMVGWELGRRIAISEGLPDPGPKPKSTMLQKAVYGAASVYSVVLK